MHGAGGEQQMVVLGGFAEVSADGLTILADVAESIEKMDRETIAARIREMEARIEKMEPGNELDKAIARLDHFKEVDHHLQTTAL